MVEGYTTAKWRADVLKRAMAVQKEAQTLSGIIKLNKGNDEMTELAEETLKYSGAMLDVVAHTLFSLFDNTHEAMFNAKLVNGILKQWNAEELMKEDTNDD